MPPVQSPRKLESLDDLLARAEHYATYSMRNMGRVPPTLFLICVNGSGISKPEYMAAPGAQGNLATKRTRHAAGLSGMADKLATVHGPA